VRFLNLIIAFHLWNRTYRTPESYKSHKSYKSYCKSCAGAENAIARKSHLTFKRDNSSVTAGTLIASTLSVGRISVCPQPGQTEVRPTLSENEMVNQEIAEIFD
jgi:hypothetical protein